MLSVSIFMLFALLPLYISRLMERTYQDDRVYEIWYNADIGEWEDKPAPGSGLITAYQTSVNAWATLATINTGYQAVVTKMRISVGGNGAALTGDFQMREAGADNIFRWHFEAMTLTDGERGRVLVMKGSLKGPIMVLAAGTWQIRTNAANEVVHAMTVYKEQLNTAN